MVKTKTRTKKRPETKVKREETKKKEEDSTESDKKYFNKDIFLGDIIKLNDEEWTPFNETNENIAQKINGFETKMGEYRVRIIEDNGKITLQVTRINEGIDSPVIYWVDEENSSSEKDQVAKKFDSIQMYSRAANGRTYLRFERTAVAALVFGCLSSSIFLLMPYLTGNAVNEGITSTSNLIGGFLFILGIFGAFVYFRKR
jgi:hypothetical protein